MSEFIGQNINCETGEITLVYSSPEIEATIAQMKLDKEALEEEAAAKAEARAALLERLGITEEEAQLLLGGN